MPPLRSGLRLGSRSPNADTQNSAGPSQPTTIALSDSEGRPRKRQAVEHKSSKARSKQKARVVLPPAAEVIEISSDDDEPVVVRKSLGSSSVFERKIRELEEENKRLRAVIAAKAPQPPASVPPSKSVALSHPTTTGKDPLLSTLEEHVSCEVCTLKMWHPYTLSCGHTFCKGCLQDWFSTSLVKHLSTHPHYDAQRLVPQHWRANLASPDLPKDARGQIEREIARILTSTSHPQYSCPTCRILIKTKPAENFVVKHLVRTIAGVQGETCPNEAPVGGRSKLMDGPFDAFFPFNGY